MVGGSGGSAAATLQIAGGGGFNFQYSGGYQLTLLFSNPTFQWAVYTGGLEVGGSGGLGIGSTKIRLAQGFSTHIEATGTTPTAASNGTAATVVGTDLAGRITVGAVPNTQLTLTFGVAFPNAPICFAQNETTAVTIRATTVGTNSVTFTATGLFVAGDAVSYICMGYY